jgi:hypothetical protein
LFVCFVRLSTYQSTNDNESSCDIKLSMNVRFNDIITHDKCSFNMKK